MATLMVHNERPKDALEYLGSLKLPTFVADDLNAFFADRYEEVEKYAQHYLV